MHTYMSQSFILFLFIQLLCCVRIPEFDKNEGVAAAAAPNINFYNIQRKFIWFQKVTKTTFTRPNNRSVGVQQHQTKNQNETKSQWSVSTTKAIRFHRSHKNEFLFMQFYHGKHKHTSNTFESCAVLSVQPIECRRLFVCAMFCYLYGEKKNLYYIYLVRHFFCSFPFFCSIHVRVCVYGIEFICLLTFVLGSMIFSLFISLALRVFLVGSLAKSQVNARKLNENIKFWMHNEQSKISEYIKCMATKFDYQRNEISLLVLQLAKKKKKKNEAMFKHESNVSEQASRKEKKNIVKRMSSGKRIKYGMKKMDFTL